MARKKLNKPLLVKVGIASVLFCAVVLVVPEFAGGDSPDKFLHRGIARLAQGRPRDSIPCFMAALRLKPTRADLLVHSGDGLNQRAGEEPGYLSWARAMWECAASLSPPSRPALDRLLASYSQEADLAPSETVFQDLARTAQAILGTDPNDARAATLAHRAAVEAWLLNKDPAADDDAELEKHLSAMETLIARDASDSDLAYCVARAKVRQGFAAAGAGKQAVANAKFDAAAAVFDPPAASGVANRPPTGADAEFRAFQLDALLTDATSHPATRPAGPGPATRPADSGPTVRLAQHLSNALKLAGPNDRLFVQIQLSGSACAERANDRPAAWQILSDLVARRPDDWQARLAAARFLAADPARRGKAIEMLDNPRGSLKAPGLAGAVAHNWELQARLEQAGLRLDLAEDSRDPAERRRLQDLVRGALPKVADPSSLPPAIRILEGRLRLSEGRTLLAIRDFRAAMEAMEQQHAPRDPKLEFRLAGAWLRIGQTGDARPLLEEVVGASPDMPQARILLAELLLSENAKDQARPHIEWLEKQSPDQPEVKRLRAGLTGRPGPAGQAVQQPPAEPSDPVAELWLASEASRTGRADAVVPHLQAAEHIAPNDPRVLQQSFTYFVGCKAWAEAEVYCAKLAAVNADQANGSIYRFQLAMARNDLETANTTARELTGRYPELSESWYAAGKVAQSQGDSEACRAAYEQTLKKQPTHAGALRGMAESYYDSPYRGMALVAIKHAREMLPNDPSFFQMQLDFEAKEEGATAALAARQEEVHSNPDDPRNWLALCGAWVRLTQDDATTHASASEMQAVADSAQASVNAMVALWPERPEMRVAAATVLRHIGKPLDAVAQLRSAIEKSPDNLAALNNLACLLLDDVSPAQPQEALALSQRAYDLMTRAHVLSPSICDTQGWALIQCGRIEEGMKLLEQTNAQAPLPAACYHLAEAFLEKSQPAQAVLQLDRAVALAEEARKQGRPPDAALIARLEVAKKRAAEMKAEHK